MLLMYINLSKIKWSGIFKVLIILFSILLIGIAGLYFYVSRHQKEMVVMLQNEFKNSYNGTLSIKKIEPNVWKQFPNISIQLQEVIIRDTSWEQHRVDFLNVKNIYVKLKFWPLLRGSLKLSKLLISDGSMTIFERQDFLDNKGIFAKENKLKSNDNATFNINEFELENFHFKVTHYHNKKHFEIQIPKLIGKVDVLNDQLHIHTKGVLNINQFSFNTDKGSYFKDKKIKMDIAVLFSTAQNLLSFEKQIVEIDNSKIEVSGDFYLAEAENYFSINIISEKIDYAMGLTWVPPTVRKSLEGYKFLRPINLDMHIEGKLNHQPIPFVSINSTFENNKLDSKFGMIDSLNMLMHFVDGSQKDSLYGDEYSTIRLTNLSGLYSSIPFTADTTTVQNIKVSKVKTHIKADFRILKLNNVFAKKSFLFGDGNVNIDIEFDGGIQKDAPYPTKISGKVAITNAQLTYRPRQLQFHDCNIFLKVKDNELNVAQSTLKTQKSELKLVAESHNFLSMYRSSPDKIIIDASINSDKIDLNEFQSFLRPREAEDADVQSKNDENSSPDFLDEALSVSSTNLTVAVQKLVFKKFEANNINAKLTLLPDGIDLQNIDLLHANGQFNIKGKYTGSNTTKPTFHIDAAIKHAAVKKMLYSFDNFGQQTFKPENLSGTINIKSNFGGDFDSQGQLVPRSLHGTTSFEISNGSLLHFQPLERIGRLVFKKDRLSNVHFEKIKNTLTLDRNKIIIPAMWVNTDLIDLQVEGTYNLGIGTNLLLEVPLFKFDKEDIAKDNTLSTKRGLRLYIAATDNDQGELKYKLKLRGKDIRPQQK